MVVLNLALAFGLELAGLVAFGLWGYELGSNLPLKGLLALLLPLVVAIFWGTFLSPRAAVGLPPNLKYRLRSTVFTLATLAFVASYHPVGAAIFAGLAIVNLTALGILRVDVANL